MDGVQALVTPDSLPLARSSLLSVQYFPGLPCLCANFPGIGRRQQRDDGAARLSKAKEGYGITRLVQDFSLKHWKTHAPQSGGS